VRIRPHAQKLNATASELFANGRKRPLLACCDESLHMAENSGFVAGLRKRRGIRFPRCASTSLPMKKQCTFPFWRKAYWLRCAPDGAVVIPTATRGVAGMTLTFAVFFGKGVACCRRTNGQLRDQVLSRCLICLPISISMKSAEN
jgi:hypothetical protein